ncbi:sigma factor AlgU regulatory protein MucB [Marinibactrum halimedae]|uniref:Sigma factor AlgU regulatory protein MucB n=2 Tax=Marinibactrum halimedae TaxID=1444977 RepID=A0AA37T7P9_9GAMM|nr:sigma factor AlgU regulatory protein MucB [Marinibactrum halimedae]
MGVLLCLMCAMSATAQNGLNPSVSPVLIEMLSHAEQSLKQLSYDGTYTYEYAGNLDTLSVSHRVDGDRQSNQITHLNGFADSVRYDSARHVCQSDPQQFAVTVGPHLAQYYQFQIVGEDRIAGRSVDMLFAQPADEYRYGFTLALDRDTRMPLMFTMLAGKRILERFQFVHFDPVSDPSTAAPMPSDNQGTTFSVNGGCAEVAESARWRLGWLPLGFSLTTAKLNQTADMLSFSDGITRFTVFVNPAQGAHTLEGEGRKGSTLVYLDKVIANGGLYQISVVGEIPVETAKKVAASLIPLSNVN